MVEIANPIYDVVFKYLMNDEKGREKRALFKFKGTLDTRTIFFQNWQSSHILGIEGGML